MSSNKEEVHPLTSPRLYEQAERAALAAMEAANAAEETLTRRLKLMDRAGAAVFSAAGVSRELAQFYAAAVSVGVLERVRNTRSRSANGAE